MNPNIKYNESKFKILPNNKSTETLKYSIKVKIDVFCGLLFIQLKKMK